MGIRLKTRVIKNLIGQTDVYARIAEEHKIASIHTIRRWARENKTNGPLTTIASLKIISQGTGIEIENLTDECHDNTTEFNSQRVPGDNNVVEGSDGKGDCKHHSSKRVDFASAN